LSESIDRQVSVSISYLLDPLFKRNEVLDVQSEKMSGKKYGIPQIVRANEALAAAFWISVHKRLPNV
jgi:hypothetical protein